MYKFKGSKYRNAVPTVAKKEDSITDLTIETPMAFGNFAAASGKLVAFCVGNSGSGRLMILDVNATGRFGSCPVLDAHSNSVTDFAFSPFNHLQLATAGADFTVKLWNLPVDGITSTFSGQPVITLSGFSSRPDTLCFHPVAENILAVTCGSSLLIYNMETGDKVFDIETGCDLIQSISWKKNGRLIALTTKDRRLLICDPRKQAIISESPAHDNHKETRVVWLGETDHVITTGFSSTRNKEVMLWDVSEKPRCVTTESFGSGTGVLMPFYDEDTRILFVAAKGDSSLTFLEFTDDPAKPTLTRANQQLLQNQTKGMCMMSKLAVDTSNTEISRLFQLTKSMLVPISWRVPRKSLRDFPQDLFPETTSDIPPLSAKQWIDGANEIRNKCSLDPAKKKPLRLNADDNSNSGSTTSVTNGSRTTPSNNGDDAEKVTAVEKGSAESSDSNETNQAIPETEEEEKTVYKPFTGVRKSKFRHWKGKIDHQSNHVTNVEPLSLTVQPTTDYFCANVRFAAVPMKGSGGIIAVIDLRKPGRLNENNSLKLQNSSAFTDLKWNPFNDYELAVSLESGVVKIWKILENKLGEMLEEPEITYKDNSSKPVVLCYHPLTENVIASGEIESKIQIWNVHTGETLISLSGHSGEIMSMAWSANGKYLASSAKDKKLRIYEPRKNTEPIQTGPGPAGIRSSRIVWVCEDEFLAVSGFEKSSCRCVTLHLSSDLSKGQLSSVLFSNAPSVLMTHYDSDSSTLFLGGKGDLSINSIEIAASEPPHLFPIASMRFDSPLQGISFLSKKFIDPRKVEFAQAWILTKSTYMKSSFSVPRVKMEYFQDDIFPPTAVTWEKTMSAVEWLKGGDKSPKKKDLQPSGMIKLSEAPPDEVKPKKYESYSRETYKTDEEKKEELLAAMSGKLDLDKKLEQDEMDGVEEDEWDDY